MEYKKALTILMDMLRKHSFNTEEKEALLTAIGLLDLGSLAKKRMITKAKLQKNKKDKAVQW